MRNLRVMATCGTLFVPYYLSLCVDLVILSQKFKVTGLPGFVNKHIKI